MVRLSIKGAIRRVKRDVVAFAQHWKARGAGVERNDLFQLGRSRASLLMIDRLLMQEMKPVPPLTGRVFNFQHSQGSTAFHPGLTSLHPAGVGSLNHAQPSISL